MVVSNVNGNVVEVVNIEPLLDRLVLNKRTEDINTDIFAIFESELGKCIYN